jgi:hypothetical protein
MDTIPNPNVICIYGTFEMQSTYVPLTLIVLHEEPKQVQRYSPLKRYLDLQYWEKDEF